MKHFKKIWAILLLITVSNARSSDAEEIDTPYHEFKTSNYADFADQQKMRIEELKSMVTSHKPVKHEEFIHTAKPEGGEKSEVKINKKLGFFDSISHWSNKRTLSKAFTDHAKNNDESATGINLSESQQKIWKTLSPDDQKDLINQWLTAHKREKLSDSTTNRTKYDNSLNKFTSKIQKEKLAEVAHQESNIITKNEKEITQINEKLKKSDVSNSEKRSLDLKKKQLQEKNKLALEQIEENLSLLKYEQDTRDALYRYNRELINDYHDKKLKNFITSINGLDSSKVIATIAKESNQAPATKTTTRTELTKELEKLVSDTSDRAMTPEELQRMKDLNEQLFGNTEETPASLATEETEIKSLSDQQIRNLSNDQLFNLMNEFEETDSKYYNNPEYQKLNAENNRRNETATQKKAQESVFDTLRLNPKEFAKLNTSETSTPASTKSTEDLEGLKRKAQNWSLTRIKEEMLDSKYSKAELEYLKAEAKSLEK
jgi:hypothetical protein